MRGTLFQIITFIGLAASREEKEELCCSEKGIPHNHADLPPFVSIEATGVCIQIDNSEVLLAAVYKSPGHAWNDTDAIELISFK
jgi:hypothetical protein